MEINTSDEDSKEIKSINRHLLDFDLIASCSICFSKQNCFCCLVCGKYYEGMGESSHGWEHYLEQGHAIYINIKTTDIQILPSMTLLNSPSLQDIKQNLDPVISPSSLSSNLQHDRTLSGSSFIVGLIPINPIKSHTYQIPVLYLFWSLEPIRDFLLTQKFSGLTEQLSLILKKMWNQSSFKGHISPHEFTYLVSVLSSSKFSSNPSGDPQFFCQWLINHLIQENFLKKLIKKNIEGKLTFKSSNKKFFLIKLELPITNPFTTEEIEKKRIEDLIEDYFIEKQIKLVKYPKYLIVMVNKFRHNKFFLEKARVQVQFDLTLTLYSARYSLVNVVALEAEAKSKSFYSLLQFHSQWFQVSGLSTVPVAESSVPLAEAYILLYIIIN